MKLTILLGLVVISLFFSCSGYINTEKVLNEIFNIKSFEEDNIKSLFIMDSYENHPFTIFARIKIDSIDFKKKIIDYYPTCDYLKKDYFEFKSFHVQNGNYNDFSRADLPSWLNFTDYKVDFVSVYDVFDYKSSCSSHGLAPY